jgi:CheY-like chemotaxis protein
LAQFEQNRPDVVITDVIMPGQDGYSVCSQIKQHPEYGGIPVVLMSGVVNKSVADKAVAVKADELIRKPFQPQELIGRVKSLLTRNARQMHPSRIARPPNALNSLFAPPPPAPRPLTSPHAADQRSPESIWPRALAEAFIAPRPSDVPAAQQNLQHAGAPPARPAPTAADLQKLRAEIARLDLLVKKLQTEMQIERQYTQALELNIAALTRLD